jgi:hypothetical protein
MACARLRQTRPASCRYIPGAILVEMYFQELYTQIHCQFEAMREFHQHSGYHRNAMITNFSLDPFNIFTRSVQQ